MNCNNENPHIVKIDEYFDRLPRDKNGNLVHDQSLIDELMHLFQRVQRHVEINDNRFCLAVTYEDFRPILTLYRCHREFMKKQTEVIGRYLDVDYDIPDVTIRGVTDTPEDAAARGEFCDPFILRLGGDGALTELVEFCEKQGVMGENRDRHIRTCLEIAAHTFLAPCPVKMERCEDALSRLQPDTMMPPELVRILSIAEGECGGQIRVYPSTKFFLRIQSFLRDVFGVEVAERLHIAFFYGHELTWAYDMPGENAARGQPNSTFVIAE